MDFATQAIRDIDDLLREQGRTVTLRRPGSPNVDVSLLAWDAGRTTGTLVGDATDDTYTLVISPTGIGTWPGGAGPIVPKPAHDQIVIGDRAYRINSAEGKYVGDTLVRVNVMCGLMKAGRS